MTRPHQLQLPESLSASFLDSIEYLRLFYQEQLLPASELKKRIAEIEQEYRQTGTYWQTEAELAYGAKVAWRNSSRCIGRIFWHTFIVRDFRHLTTAEDIFAALVSHLDFSTNGGNIRSTISIFAPDSKDGPRIRIWNPQLIRYAGYRQANGTIVGDPDQVELTEIAQHMGWKGQGTPFDILPVIIQVQGQKPQLFELPKEVVLEVPMVHPEYDWFAELGLKWFALPAVSHWRLEIGGVSYTCAPFSGWYMGAEIGARNFGDEKRYNLLPTIAKHMGLNTRSKLSLWKDQAMIELNRAVLHSFDVRHVRIVDHHTASTQFMQHWQREAKAGRTVPADWGRVVPPLSASTMEVFHQEMEDATLKPNFFFLPPPWKGLRSNPSSSVDSRSPKRCPF